MNRKELIADTSLLMVAAIWGATFVLVKNALADITPFFFNAIRFMMAAAILILISRNRLSKINKELLFSGTLIGLILFAGYSFQTIGLQFTSASNTAFITGLSVVMVPFFSMALTKKRPASGAITGAVAAAVGLSLLSLDESLHINKGDLLVFFSAISFALHIIAVGKFSPMYDTFSLVTVQVAAVGLFSTVSAFLLEPIPVVVTGQVWIALLVTAVLATALAFLIQNWMQKFTTPTKTAVIFSMEPVFGALFAYWLLGEVMSTRDWWGSALVLSGMLLAEVPWKNPFRKQPVVDRKKNKHTDQMYL